MLGQAIEGANEGGMKSVKRNRHEFREGGGGGDVRGQRRF